MSPGSPLRAAWLRPRGRRAVTFLCLSPQHSDSDSEPEFSSLSPSIPSAIPVTGESYCNCENQSEAPYCSSLHALHRVKDCQCGEEDECKGRGSQTTRWSPLGFEVGAVLAWGHGLRLCVDLCFSTGPLSVFQHPLLLCLHLKAM